MFDPRSNLYFIIELSKSYSPCRKFPITSAKLGRHFGDKSWVTALNLTPSKYEQKNANGQAMARNSPSVIVYDCLARLSEKYQYAIGFTVSPGCSCFRTVFIICCARRFRPSVFPLFAVGPAKVSVIVFMACFLS